MTMMLAKYWAASRRRIWLGGKKKKKKSLPRPWELHLRSTASYPNILFSDLQHWSIWGLWGFQSVCSVPSSPPRKARTSERLVLVSFCSQRGMYSPMSGTCSLSAARTARCLQSWPEHLHAIITHKGLGAFFQHHPQPLGPPSKC